MSDTSLRARSVTEIVDAAFSLYTRNIGQYILVTSIAYSPSLVIALLLGNRSPADAVGGTALLVSLIVSVLGYALMTGTIVSLGSKIYMGEGVDVAAAVKQALPKVPALIGSAILMTLLYFIGLLCFFVGFFYVAARFFAVVPAIVLEGKGPLQALGRSSELSDGKKGHILGTLVLVYGIYIVVSIGISAVLAFAGNFMLLTLASTLFTIVAFPVIGLTTMVLYYDARIRGEGFDLERMTQGLGAAPAAGNSFS